MRVSLLLGFLGAGKTTLLQQILERGVENERLAVIVNEFGTVGVDGDILTGRAIDTVELASGCICCSLKESMLDAIAELAETVEPDRLLVEASGVAQPEDLVAALTDPSLAGTVDLAPIVTLVDASRFRRMVSAMGPFYAAQVTHADIVVINKIDLVSPAELDAVRGEVATLNPRADILLAERCDIDQERLLTGPSPRISEVSLVRYHNHIDMISIIVELNSTICRDDIFADFAQLQSTVYRAKGFGRIDGQSHLIQYASGKLELTPVEQRERHYLVFIGHDLDRERLTRLFGELGDNQP